MFKASAQNDIARRWHVSLGYGEDYQFRLDDLRPKFFDLGFGVAHPSDQGKSLSKLTAFATPIADIQRSAKPWQVHFCDLPDGSSL